MAEDNSGWSLTESDPSVFTALLTELGVKGLQVEDLWSLEDEALKNVGEIKAFIFLFKYVGGIEESKKAGSPDPDFPGFFAHQVIDNACATLAILNSVFNLPLGGQTEDDKIELGAELDNLKEFGHGMDPSTLGYTISNSDKIREVHNSFARSDPFSIDSSIPSEPSDAYHFISYLPSLGTLYELDGLQSYPRSHGPVPTKDDQEWIGRAREVIQERISSYPMGALEFSLLAVVKDPMSELRKELKEAEKAGQEYLIGQVKEKIEEEEAKRKKWAFENSLRKHNHISFAHQLLLGLAKAGSLNSAIDSAKLKAKDRKDREIARKAKAGEKDTEMS
ncbi:ubiquitin-specific protease [Phaffia rhodozyma]|uniref:Ubiquitin carboxyl-terminal hydrolase n=1 Tax=Phaffia rhodozyma TaxID=264483 RepID=A0A0F7SNB4_PHARH|nr:ubiquitin-specific protease [Phaffia rhodozyma]